jgi:hypothetical protein
MQREEIALGLARGDSIRSMVLTDQLISEARSVPFRPGTQ